MKPHYGTIMWLSETLFWLVSAWIQAINSLMFVHKLCVCMTSRNQNYTPVSRLKNDQIFFIADIAILAGTGQGRQLSLSAPSLQKIDFVSFRSWPTLCGWRKLDTCLQHHQPLFYVSYVRLACAFKDLKSKMVLFIFTGICLQIIF